MTVAQVADRLGIGKSTVYLLVAEGKLRCMRHGIGRGTIRISDEHLAEYMRLAEGIDADRQGLRFIQ